MSTCISQHGEYSDHILDDVFECIRCDALDEDTLLVEVRQLRTENAGLREALEASQADRDRLRQGVDRVLARHAQLATLCEADVFDLERYTQSSSPGEKS